MTLGLRARIVLSLFALLLAASILLGVLVTQVHQRMFIDTAKQAATRLARQLGANLEADPKRFQAIFAAMPDGEDDDSAVLMLSSGVVIAAGGPNDGRARGDELGLLQRENLAVVQRVRGRETHRYVSASVPVRVGSLGGGRLIVSRSIEALHARARHAE